MNETQVKEKTKFSNRIVIILLIVIGIVSLLIRLYYFDPNIPLSLDSLVYFFYAYDTSLIGHLPQNYSILNNGWPLFLSNFFSLFEFDNGVSYMEIQRLLSVTLSVITIIPVYHLCRKFFSMPLSLVGASIFAFEPRIIQNSLFGITEPLYILLISLALVLFLSSNNKLTYVSFGITALATMVRAEGIMLFFIISIMFFAKFKRNRFVIPKYLPALFIFILILLPMSLYRIETIGNDAMVGRLGVSIERTSNEGLPFLIVGLENFIKFFGWDLIPIFIFFVPIGIILIFKSLNYRSITILASLVSLSLPAIYAYSIPALDTRYLFVLYPLFCILSIFTIDKFTKKFSNQNIILLLIIVGIFLGSIFFLEIKLMDVEHEKDSVLIGKYIISSSVGINSYYPESQYLESLEILDNWQEVKKYFYEERSEGVSVREMIPHKVVVFSTDGYSTLENFILSAKDKGLTHLVIDKNSNRPEFLTNVFYDDSNYPFLIKEFDSSEHEIKYHVKIYKIDFDKFP